MILFCEDCSSRNDLSSPRVEGNKIVFRCSSCGYFNRITPPGGVCQTPFDQLTAEPGIIGAFSYHVRKGIRHSRMPDILRKKDLMLLGKRVISSYKIALLKFPDVSRLTLAIDNRNLVFHPFEPDYGLIIVCRSLPLTSEVEKRLADLGMGGLELDGLDIFDTGKAG